MKRYIYLSLTPEALIASMLGPEEFGSYQAIGTKKRTRGQAIFIEVDIDKIRHLIPWDFVEKKCIPQEDGKPKSSVYLSIYRTLELIPIDALKNLYLTTSNGRVLELQPEEYKKDEDNKLFLYQEIAPVTPRVACSLEPSDFVKYMTNEDDQIHVPKIAFVDLQLGDLAHDPINGSAGDLPYSNIHHLRDCLLILQNEPKKFKKTVIRFFHEDILYRVCKSGFYVGDNEKMIFYKFPERELLESKYLYWWRSALQS